MERARGFVVLPGKAGTLAELALLWALDRARCLGQRPVVLLGAPWRPLVEFLERSAMVEAEQVHRTQVVDTPEQAVALLAQRRLGARP
jgi:predicted Rossmann-fold nucleotide-binding protein